MQTVYVVQLQGVATAEIHVRATSPEDATEAAPYLIKQRPKDGDWQFIAAPTVEDVYER